MNIYYNIKDVPYDKNTVITVGTFDGVHLGHKEIIQKLTDLATKTKSRSFIVTLDPHPRIVLNENKSNTANNTDNNSDNSIHKTSNNQQDEIKLLNDLEDRLKLFEDYGVENVLVINFTKDFAKTSPLSFIEDIIYKNIGFNYFLIGYDHSFGKNREGDINLLLEINDTLNFEIEQVAPLLLDENAISSTKVRKSISNGEIQIANKMLGYDYYIKGFVVEGFKRGRQIGFPTANIEISDKYRLIPMNGVYVVKLEIENYSTKLFGMANIGFRPTFDNDKKLTIEINIFDFNQDIYGNKLKVSFIDYIRNEQKFNSIDEIISQLNKDKIHSLEFVSKL